MNSGLYEVGMKALSDKVITNFSSILPGHLVNATVKKHAANGLRCSFLGGIQVSDVGNALQICIW